MQQVLQNLKNGKIELADLPCPQINREEILIRTQVSLISAGTERMLLEFGRANWLDKARQQPDKLQQVLQKIKTDGLWPTVEAVRHKLDQPLALGYCNVGTVIAKGDDVQDFALGDRVVSNGAHAQYVISTSTLSAKIPNEVSNLDAAFTPLGSIALQGVRLALPTLGETFAVFGLGLIGLLAVQCLKAHGCQVVALDFHPERLRLAQQFGAHIIDLNLITEPEQALMKLTAGSGIDGAIIATATDDNAPIRQAAQSCRKRGRIILIGTSGLELSRGDFYQKELTFQVSCSYGPGRYDPLYEQQNHDYPLGFVRWTSQRNFQAILHLMAHHQLEVSPLVSHQFNFNDADKAYDLLASRDFSLGIALEYEQEKLPPDTTIAITKKEVMPSKTQETFQSAVIGAGNYATRFLLPAFRKTSLAIQTICSRQGVSAFRAARQFKIPLVTSDRDMIFSNPALNPLIIATRHDSHADLVVRGLRAQKHVFVEKPLAINHQQLADIKAAYANLASPVLLMVGFNRRFSPLIVKAKALLKNLTEPKVFIMTINAGFIPDDHWTQDPQQGGRIIGEACHFVDLLKYLCDKSVQEWTAYALDNKKNPDSVTIQLRFTDDSLGTIHYLANGHHGVPKERLEIYCAGKILQLDNFRTLRGYGWGNFKKMHLFRQNKGQEACVAAFANALLENTASPIPAEELFEVTQLMIDIHQAITD